MKEQQGRGAASKKPTAKAKAPAKKPLKKVPGKSEATSKMPEYKPHIYLDGKQVPKEIAGVKPGATVTVTAQAKVVRKSEGLGGERSVSIELDKMAVSKGAAGKKG